MKPYPMVVLAVVLLLTPSFGVSKSLDEISSELRTSIAQGELRKSINRFSDLGGRILELWDETKTGREFIDSIGTPIQDGMSILAGDAVKFRDWQEMLQKDTERFKSSYQFSTVSPRSYDLNTATLEKLSDTELIREYAVASNQVTSDIERYDEELGRLDDHKADLLLDLNKSDSAFDHGIEVAKKFRELGDEGKLQLPSVNQTWVEFEIYIIPEITERSNAINEAIERVNARIQNLQNVRERAEKFREWVDFFWWYEVFKQGPSSQQGGQVAGMNALNTAKSVDDNAVSDGEAAIGGILAETRAAKKLNEGIVAELERERAAKDSRAARLGRMQSLLSLSSSVLSASSKLSQTESPRIQFKANEVKELAPDTNLPPTEPLVIPDSLVEPEVPIYRD